VCGVRVAGMLWWIHTRAKITRSEFLEIILCMTANSAKKNQAQYSNHQDFAMVKKRVGALEKVDADLSVYLGFCERLV
jgi:hypothetical protein